MLVKTTELGIQVAPPRSFGGLMALYENSYIRFKRLVGEIDALANAAVSVVPSDLPLHATMLHRAPYTTILRLTYWFEKPLVCLPEPDLVLRVYHDARMVEAQSCAPTCRHQFLNYRVRESHDELGRAWQRNRLLNKWLDYLIECGHRLT